MSQIMQNLVRNQTQFSKHQRNAKFLFDQRNFSSYRTSKALRSSDHHTPFENAQRWMGKNTFPILLLNDDNMIGEH